MMESLMDAHTVDKYLNEVQRLKVISTKQPQKLDELLDYVSARKKATESNDENGHLFSGEYAFHKGQYEQALINYMQAKDVPLFEFFCYRATAFVSFQRNDMEKAINFVRKALDIKPQDYDTLKLQRQIYTAKGDHQEAAETEKKIQTIEKEFNRNSFTPQASQQEEAVAPALPFTRGTTSEFIASKLGVDLDTEKALEERIQEFQTRQCKQIEAYLEESKRNKTTKDYFLSILSGWTSSSKTWMVEQEQKNSGGFFIRWNGKGIVINPGANFLANFHRQGMHMGDIHYVVVTQDMPEAYADIKKIYDFNYRLNKINPELHVIDYYLHHKAYQDLSHILKPNFKQERNTVHSLELFLDSPDVEKEDLEDGIRLNYFAASTRGGYQSRGELSDASRSGLAHAVAIRFDLSRANEKPVTLGYVSGTAWSPLLAHHLGQCDILISGFGTTSPNDYGKLNYNENSLGYFGTYTLLEEIRPKLLLCAEFDGREGDIRLEIAKKLRKEYEKASRDQLGKTTILPADNGLTIELGTRKVECTLSKAALDPKDVIVVKTSETYGNLQYLSPTCLL